MSTSIDPQIISALSGVSATAQPSALSTKFARALARSVQKDSKSLGSYSPERIEEIVAELVTKALSSGLPRNIPFDAESQGSPSSGSTAKLVRAYAATVPFYIKMDTDPVLKHEAEHLIEIQSRPDLPLDAKALFPKVYAHRIDEPYAYIMEAVPGTKLETSIFEYGLTFEVKDVVEELWRTMFDIYKVTATSKLTPSVTEIYFSRIENTARSVKSLAGQGNANAKVLCSLFGRSFTSETENYHALSWYQDCLSDISTNLSPAFSSFVHGDLHPENILTTIKKDVRLIDPKPWRSGGDYMFDVGRFVSYLLVSGPHSKKELTHEIKGSSVTIDHLT